jgi:hypothetical protein
MASSCCGDVDVDAAVVCALIESFPVGIYTAPAEVISTRGGVCEKVTLPTLCDEIDALATLPSAPVGAVVPILDPLTGDCSTVPFSSGPPALCTTYSYDLGNPCPSVFPFCVTDNDTQVYTVLNSQVDLDAFLLANWPDLTYNPSTCLVTGCVPNGDPQPNLFFYPATQPLISVDFTVPNRPVGTAYDPSVYSGTNRFLVSLIEYALAGAAPTVDYNDGTGPHTFFSPAALQYTQNGGPPDPRVSTIASSTVTVTFQPSALAGICGPNLVRFALGADLAHPTDNFINMQSIRPSFQLQITGQLDTTKTGKMSSLWRGGTQRWAFGVSGGGFAPDYIVGTAADLPASLEYLSFTSLSPAVVYSSCQLDPVAVAAQCPGLRGITFYPKFGGDVGPLLALPLIGGNGGADGVACVIQTPGQTVTCSPFVVPAFCPRFNLNGSPLPGPLAAVDMQNMACSMAAVPFAFIHFGNSGWTIFTTPAQTYNPAATACRATLVGNLGFCSP